MKYRSVLVLKHCMLYLPGNSDTGLFLSMAVKNIFLVHKPSCFQLHSPSMRILFLPSLSVACSTTKEAISSEY